MDSAAVDRDLVSNAALALNPATVAAGRRRAMLAPANHSYLNCKRDQSCP